MQPYRNFNKKFHNAICGLILATGFVFVIIPESWVTSSVFSEFNDWIRVYWPKMDSDAQYIGRYDLSRGSKYVLVNVFSAISFVTLALGSIWISRKQVVQPKQLPSAE